MDEGASSGARGLVIVLSGPSGVGKSTLIAGLRGAFPELVFSVSATTRAPRTGEVDGVDYDFVTPEAFAEGIVAGAFVEHASVYGRSYGTQRSRIEASIASGASVLLDIDAQGSAQVRASMKEAIHVFVAPPSVEELERRLRSRATDDEPTIARRMREAAEQIAAAPTYDYVVVNDRLTDARDALIAIVRAERARAWRAAPVLSRLLAGLSLAGGVP